MACAAAGALLCGASTASALLLPQSSRRRAHGLRRPTRSINIASVGSAGTSARGGQVLRPALPGRSLTTLDENITIVAGATEGFAARIRALAEPGDTVAFFEPCHELYPSQLALFGMRPRAVTLTAHETDWAFDAAELEAALRRRRFFCLMTLTTHGTPLLAGRTSSDRETVP